MRNRIRPRLSYANVMSSIAVFVVLGGVAVAQQRITSSQIAKNAVKTKQLAPTSVKQKQIAKNAVRRGKLPNGVIGTGKIADGAVETDKIGDLAVVTDKIAPGAVEHGRIADGAIDALKLANGAVGTAQLNPAIAGVALAGVQVNAAGTIQSSFNRFGGPPNIQPVAAGIKGISFPGLDLNFPDFVHQATINGGATGFIRVRNPLGANDQDVEVRTHSTGAALASRGFSYTVYATP